MNRFIPSLIASLFAIFVSVPSLAAEVPYSQVQFEAAQTAGEPVAVAFHAKWCSTCRIQAPVLTSLMGTSEMKRMTLYVADFDKEKALRESLGVTGASTIVVFRGGKEITRSAGDVSRRSLAVLLKRALS
jgi:thioredoxin 1